MKSKETPDAKIARLEEERNLLWVIIGELEEWMFGEGCFMSERTKAKIEMARKIINDEPLAFPKKLRNAAYWTEERRKERAEQSRKIITEYWKNKKAQPR